MPYAREHSSVNIHGDAYTWWDKAAGLYDAQQCAFRRFGHGPDDYAGRHRGHVAVVRRMVSPREIRIDHANWLNDGAIYVNDPVLDVSPDNDWSQVKVWNIRSGTWGTKVYLVQWLHRPGDRRNPTSMEPLPMIRSPVRSLRPMPTRLAPAAAHSRHARAVR